MIWFELLVVIGLVLLNGFFAMSELAVVSARRARLQQLAEQGRRGARTALGLQEEPTRFLSTVQIGITLIGVLAGAYSGATLSEPLSATLVGAGVPPGTAGTLALVIVVVGITYLSLILGELVPKRLALADAAGIAIRVAGPLRWISRFGAPLVWVLQRSTELVLRSLGMKSEATAQITEEEIRALIAEGAESGVLHRVEREMIEGVMRVADRPARSIMTPRLEVDWLDATASPQAIRETIVRSGHSRFPVTHGRRDELVGVVQAKDVAVALLGGAPLDLTKLARPPLIVPENAPVLRVLDQFRAGAIHLALVVDEYGSFEGIITPTDVLIAIAGELPEGARTELPEAVQRDDGSWLVDGRMELHQVERLLELRGMTSDHDYTTLAGFVLWQLGRLPTPADHFQWRHHRFEVVDMDGRRIDKVLVVPPG
jgi:putative hemolysin